MNPRNDPMRLAFAVAMSVFVFAQCSLSFAVTQESDDQQLIKIATFDVDATPPLGSDMAYDPVKRIGELSLRCRGIVILGSGKPIVLCAVDWIGIANEGHDAFRSSFAKAAGTTPDRVAVHALHQHDAPGCDFTAERILRELGQGKIGRFEGTFHRLVIERASKAIQASIPSATTATHYGFGAADVEKVASNRRILGDDGRVRAVRYTTTKDPVLRAEPEGVIDRQVSVLSFWNNKQPIATLSYYACHPQSYYRTGIPSPDFPGIARFVRGESLPQALLVHFNGAGGNIGAGKYNDGEKANRMKLALRLADGMKRAYEATEKKKLVSKDIEWQSVPVQLPAAKHLDRAKLVETVKTTPIKGYIDKADQLAWLQRCNQNHPIDVACLSVGDSRVLHLPGELFVEYQLAAKAMRPDLKVAMAAYGDYGPGYIGTKIAYSEGGYETSERASNVTPDSEQILMDAITKLLKPDSSNLKASNSKDQNSESQSQDQPLSPKQALNSFEVPDGFEMQLVASEPNVQEPVAISYDEDGRMYAAEYLKFPATGGKSDGPNGRIRLLTDQDDDGFYETGVVFADELAWPTGICPWKGGVYVIAAPDLWYLKDTDGDGKADVREKVFTGFGFSNEEGTANNLIWGLDHWIYGAGSNSGGDIRPADQPLARPISIRSSDFRFHPKSRKFEAISGSEQFGNTFDSWGNRFICQNSKPAVHVVLPAHYLARNPYLPVSAVRKNIWEGDKVYRSSQPESWRVARTRSRKSQKRKWSAPFVEHDVFTACTGVTIYRGQIYPADFHENLFVGDVQSNLVHRRVLQPHGATYKSLRVDENTEVVRSTDNWFRPVNFCNAPDGTLHIVDMYRELIETPDSLPEEILATVNLQRGHDLGRVYRLAPTGFSVSKQLLQLGAASTTQLVKELEGQNGWRRATASRLIYENQDSDVVAALRKIARESNSPQARLHALYTLEGLGELQAEDITRCLQSVSAGLREHAVRLAEAILSDESRMISLSDDEAQRVATANENLVVGILGSAEDPNPRVRFQVAFTLGELNDRRAADSLCLIAKRDADDPWIRTAILSSSLNYASSMLEKLLVDSEFRSTAGGLQVLKQLSVVVGGKNRTEEVIRLLDIMNKISVEVNDDTRRTVIIGLGEGLRLSRSSLAQLVEDGTPTAEMISKLVKQALQTLKTRAAGPAQIQAIEFLAHGKWEEVSESLELALSSRRSPTVQLAAVHGMASFSNPAVSDVLIKKWAELSPSVQGEVIETLLSRSDWTHSLLAAIEHNKVPRFSITPLRQSQLLKHNDDPIRSLAVKLFKSDKSESNKPVLDKYLTALSLEGDAKRGATVFKNNCMSCHRAGGKGHDVGPNLATTQNKTPDSLLVEILDPNRNIQADYMQHLVLLDDGRLVSGMISAESPTSITLKRAEDIQETVLRQNIDEIRASGKSLMPEGLEKEIRPREMSDLIAYLRSL